MATGFENSTGFYLIDYRPADALITGEYNANIIKEIRALVKRRWGGGASRWFPFAR